MATQTRADARMATAPMPPRAMASTDQRRRRVGSRTRAVSAVISNPSSATWIQWFRARSTTIPVLATRQRATAAARREYSRRPIRAVQTRITVSHRPSNTWNTAWDRPQVRMVVASRRWYQPPISVRPRRTASPGVPPIPHRARYSSGTAW